MMVFGDRRRLTARPETYPQLMNDARNAFRAKRAVEDGWVLRLEPKAAPIIKLEDKPQEAPKRKRACSGDIAGSALMVINTDLDKAAKSTVTLNPNTIAKVFLVLRGVFSMVGTDVDGMEDQSKFRVIEWGGMEANLELE
ncbi:hypothetical protein CTAM01_02562 [Colletotrichum tamarilloi]|uniref:Uncharacterized protein n=1 Tax=Colletotrichum tamarilloi TaxID=1209934 RepID=A0ABQ9RMU2_9PEZI|nr:uncharacterized protein CTAM01_02562 [Colletotrichum tamarilloi]KAK1507450.1 hypothetical protein CTAM01_02562 [Colletotrichum tamarilloi]